MRLLSLTVLTLLLLGPAAALAKAKDDKTTGRDYFRFGMEQQEAEKVLASGGEDWQVFYRIDGEDALEVACGWRSRMYYHIKFFDGRCYHIEKRAEATRDEVERVITAYTKHYGTTAEATESSDRSLYFARWSLRDREITLSASQGRGGVFKLFYEEFDPLVAGSARRSQERQMDGGAGLPAMMGRSPLARVAGMEGAAEAGSPSLPPGIEYEEAALYEEAAARVAPAPMRSGELRAGEFMAGGGDTVDPAEPYADAPADENDSSTDADSAADADEDGAEVDADAADDDPADGMRPPDPDEW